MFKRRNRSRRFIGTLLLTALLAVAAYAFTASNTVPDTLAGDGSGDITGYAVSNVHYVLASNPANVDYWTFDLNDAAGTVQSKVVSASASYVSCANSGGMSWRCDPAAGVEPTVLAADELRVIATS
jgi:hypothetical protein